MVLAISIFAVAFLGGCETIPLNPITTESRAVHATTDTTKTLSVPEGMVFYDPSETHGLRFPAGKYTLEAEDADFWYLRSPDPLELRVLKDGAAIDGRKIPGGIMIPKQFNIVLAGAAYIDGEGTAKVMIWKLGGEFLRQEGRGWTKSF